MTKAWYQISIYKNDNILSLQLKYYAHTSHHTLKHLTLKFHAIKRKHLPITYLNTHLSTVNAHRKYIRNSAQTPHNALYTSHPLQPVGDPLQPVGVSHATNKWMCHMQPISWGGGERVTCNQPVGVSHATNQWLCHMQLTSGCVTCNKWVCCKQPTSGCATCN